MSSDMRVTLEIRKNGKWELNKENLFDFIGVKDCDAPFVARNYLTMAMFSGNDWNWRDAKIKGMSPIRCVDTKYISDYGNGKPYSLKEGDSDLYEQELSEETLHEIRFDREWNIYILTLKQLLDFDYSEVPWKDDSEATHKTLKEWYFNDDEPTEYQKDLEILKTLGVPEDVRIIFSFSC